VSSLPFLTRSIPIAYPVSPSHYSAESKTIPAHGKALIDTQLSIAVPAGTYGRVAPRSGLASKHSIHTGAGVIDADYRGCVFVLLFNLGEVDFQGEFRCLRGSRDD
jgi:dUTP pyrophosphatase